MPKRSTTSTGSACNSDSLDPSHVLLSIGVPEEIGHGSMRFTLNNTKVGSWTSPGDFGDVHGMFTPDWWFPNWNQYGLLKMLVIGHLLKMQSHFLS